MTARGRQGISAQFVFRLLIVSYFVALSLGLTQGAELRKISDPFLPADLSHYAMRALILTLSGMVLFDVQRRAAALILSLFVFWSSYLAIYLGGNIEEFWLNLALIGGLLHIGGVGAEEDSVAGTDVTLEKTKVEQAGHRANSKKAPGCEIPYRKDLEVVRDL